MLEYVEVPLSLQVERNKFANGLNSKIGKGDWFWGFRAGKKLYSWSWGLQLYEDAYWSFFKQSPTHIRNLVAYSNVYVYGRGDIESSLDYKKQTQLYDHFQDIAIRRCLVRFGVWFKGMDFLKLPGSDFDDSKVHFHLPHLIHKPDAISSIKSWLSNRLIIVARTIEDKARLAEVLIK